MSLSAECIFSMLLTAEEKVVLRRLREMPDAEISYSDTPVLNEDTAKRIIDFEFALDEQARIHELIAKNSTDGLSAEEKLELEQFLNIERILVILKARSIRMVEQFGMGMFERPESVVAPHEEVLRWHDEQLKNRPDWHSKPEQSPDDPVNGRTIRHEDIAHWNDIETLSVEDLIAEAIQEGKTIQGINDPETLEYLQLGDGSYNSEEIRFHIDRWAMIKYGRSNGF